MQYNEYFWTKDKTIYPIIVYQELLYQYNPLSFPTTFPHRFPMVSQSFPMNVSHSGKRFLPSETWF